MFYSQFILAKKGPLGTIWIAAHLERKLRKNQVADTDIGVSVDSILYPEVPIALRLSSHLLLGVARIYSRKVSYLFDDCSEALLKIKQAFRSTAVDLPPEESKAPYHSITLPETYDLDDFELPDNDIIQGNYVDHHVSAREQITLQDPMDGLVFSSSKFGLDERFGDGDTSQIGLDLEEELLFEKGMTSGHGEIVDSSTIVEASVGQSSLFQDAKSVDEIYEASVATASNSFDIQVPSIPGLLEEPSFLSAGDTLGRDDHMDEDQNSTEFVEKELVAADSIGSKAYSLSSRSVLSPPEENGQHHGHDEVERATSEVQDLTQLPLANETFLSSGSMERGNLQIQDHTGDEPPAAPPCFPSKEALGDGYPQGGALPYIDNGNPSHQDAGAASEICACDPRIDDCHSKSQVNDLCSLHSGCLSYIDKPSAGPGVLNTIELDWNVQDNTSWVGNTESPACPKPEHPGSHESISTDSVPVILGCNSHYNSGQEKLLSTSEPLLQACSSHLDDANSRPRDMASAPCQPCCDVGFSASETSERDDAANISLETVVQEHSNFDGQADCVTSSNSVSGKQNIAAVTELPSPEKLLSAPNADGSDVVLVDSTPAKDILVEVDGDSTLNLISGKKRSFTESTLTFRCITSVESITETQSKNSVEFIPNDDDLLSSILVGRRLSVLRVKPTPPVLDVDSVKRRRVTPCTTAHKRKVLLDDSLVLHGDTIRRQLIDTEDIRRLRKKAPCTRLEIWRLEKRLLEDEIFIEPLLLGMSAKLISLHSQPFDPSRIRIVRDEEKAAEFSAPAQMDSWTRPGYEESQTVGNNSESVARDTMGGQHPEEIVNQQNTEVSLNLDHGSVQNQLKFFEDEHEQTFQLDTLGPTVPIRNEGRSIPVGEGAEHSVNLANSLPSASSASLEKGVSTDDAVISSISWTKNNAADVPVQYAIGASLQIDVMCCPTDHELDSQTAYLADQFDKDELEQRWKEVQFIKQKEGFDSFATTTDTCTDHSSHVDGMNAFTAASPESRVLADSDKALSGSVANQCELSSKDMVLGFNQNNNLVLEHHDMDLRLDSSTVDVDLYHVNNMSATQEDVRLPDDDPQVIMDPITASNHSIIEEHVQDFESEKIVNDTDFLNVDDDNDAAENGDNNMENAEEFCMEENIGWSARTRAVANYLQVLFHKEAMRGRGVVHLDNLLTGKSRKEASRMFFETLVLKTKDYVHVEQEDAFCNISVRPRQQLMKLEF